MARPNELEKADDPTSFRNHQGRGKELRERT
jgi:hypothetical protein